MTTDATCSGSSCDDSGDEDEDGGGGSDGMLYCSCFFILNSENQCISKHDKLIFSLI